MHPLLTGSILKKQGLAGWGLACSECAGVHWHAGEFNRMLRQLCFRVSPFNCNIGANLILGMVDRQNLFSQLDIHGWASLIEKCEGSLLGLTEGPTELTVRCFACTADVFIIMRRKISSAPFLLGSLQRHVSITHHQFQLQSSLMYCT